MKTISRPAILAVLAMSFSAVAGAQDAADLAPVANDSPTAPSTAPLDSIPVPVATEPVPAATEPAKTGAHLEEIVVTAQKREENIQNVPIAIAAFSASMLENGGVTNISDLAKKTPGLNYDTFANYAIIYVRGVGTDAFVPSADLSVATYVDGVYFPFSFGLARALGDVERVEVLKGPQGTLFGRNATGGAINIVTKDPNPNQWTGSLSSTIARFNEYDNRISFGGPLLSDLSVSGGLVYNRKDDYYKSISTEYSKLMPYRDLGGTLKLKWTPSEYFDARLGGFYLASQGVGTTLLASIAPSPLGTALGVHTSPDYQTDDNIYSFAKTTTAVGSLTLAVHPGSFDIKSITAYQRETENLNTDFDGSSANLFSFGNVDQNRNIQRGHVFTQELQILSNSDSPWSDYLKWIAGLYYLKSTFGYVPVQFAIANLQNGPSGIGSGTFPVGTGLNTLLANATSALGPLVDPLVKANLAVFGALDTESEAAYTQATYTPVDWLDLTVGGRFQKENRTVYNTKLNAQASIAGQPVDRPVFDFAPQSLSASNFAPKFALDVKPYDDVMLYTSFQRAFKSASFNVVNLTEPPTSIGAETVSTIEAGAKTQFFDHSLQVNAAIYRNRIHNLQSQFLSLISGGIIQFQNAKLATAEGTDLDITWVPVSGLQLNAGWTYLNSRYNSFDDALGFNPQTGVFGRGNDYTGNRIVRNPRNTVTAGAEYAYDVSQGTITLAGDYYYNSGYFYDPANVIGQKAYSLVNARLTYLHLPWNLRVSLFGDNLNRAKYYLYKLQDDTGVVGKLAPPISYGIRIGWDFL